jgi:hypothetical protein
MLPLMSKRRATLVWNRPGLGWNAFDDSNPESETPLSSSSKALTGRFGTGSPSSVRTWNVTVTLAGACVCVSKISITSGESNGPVEDEHPETISARPIMRARPIVTAAALLGRRMPPGLRHCYTGQRRKDPGTATAGRRRLLRSDG